MHGLLLFKPDHSHFDLDATRQAFSATSQFSGFRVDEPGGALLECQYIDRESRTIIWLNKDASTISTSNAGTGALRAAFLIQKALGIPLRLVDSAYSFDLTFSDVSTMEELEAAVDNARRS